MKISSMTAFANRETQGEWGYARWELRSTNHRYLEISFKMPELFKELEFECRDIARKNLSRGKVDCALLFESKNQSQNSKQIKLNMDLVAGIVDASHEIDKKSKSIAPLSIIDILKWPGVVTTPELDTQSAGNALQNLFLESIKELLEVRGREGDTIKTLLNDRVIKMQDWVLKIKNRLPEIERDTRLRLEERLKGLQVQYDVGRLEQEMVYLLQRLDVSEEIDRILSHLKEVSRVLEEGGTVGRRLDFLMQELNRESNTLSSKSVDQETTQASVELKVLIEQMREQIQNLE